jgi:hypothetical protein
MSHFLTSYLCTCSAYLLLYTYDDVALFGYIQTTIWSFSCTVRSSGPRVAHQLSGPGFGRRRKLFLLPVDPIHVQHADIFRARKWVFRGMGLG